MGENSKKSVERFRDLLRELFQFGNADLNFGIYRVMNQKRERMEAVIRDDIVRAVDAALDPDASAKAARAAAAAGDDAGAGAVTRKAGGAGQNTGAEDVAGRGGGDGDDAGGGGAAVGDDRAAALAGLQAVFEAAAYGTSAFGADGKLKPEFRAHPAAKAWDLLRGDAHFAGAATGDELRDEAFNRLYDFFSRYYDDGDFLCRQRYSADGRYAVPYNGEEVVLHWANKHQYYVKTTEHFSRYEYRVGGGAGVAMVREFRRRWRRIYCGIWSVMLRGIRRIILFTRICAGFCAVS